jgi:catechol 2,3-dioxygenase-like lactoylglutathione lyase family enzyme
MGVTVGITRLNHAVLYVSDVDRSAAFYSDVLGFRTVAATPPGMRAAFLQAPDSTNDHDLGLFEIGAQAGAHPAGRGAVGLYHLAWEVDTLQTLERTAQRLSEAGALVGATDHGGPARRRGHRGPDQAAAAGSRGGQGPVRRDHPRRCRGVLPGAGLTWPAVPRSPDRCRRSRWS